MTPDRHARTMLTIPDRPAHGLTTYDAKDPHTRFPPIEPLPRSTRGSRFTGTLHWVQLDVGTDDHDHFIAPEERLRAALSRQ